VNFDLFVRIRYGSATDLRSTAKEQVRVSVWVGLGSLVQAELGGPSPRFLPAARPGGGELPGHLAVDVAATSSY
jgi:hypothetical protein